MHFSVRAPLSNCNKKCPKNAVSYLFLIPKYCTLPVSSYFITTAGKNLTPDTLEYLINVMVQLSILQKKNVANICLRLWWHKVFFFVVDFTVFNENGVKRT